MEKISYGIIGSGNHALHSHALPALELDELELSAICDISEDRLESFASQFGHQLQTFTNREEFLRSQIGAVLIATPDEAHFGDMVAALEAGKHVFVEKPVAATAENAAQLRSLLKDASQAGLVVSSCHARRFDPPFMWLKDSLPELTASLGKPLDFQFDFSYSRPVQHWKQERGLLLDHANHEIDLANFYFGRSGFEAHRLANTHDYYRVVGVRDDDITMALGGTRRLTTPNFQERMRIRFDTGEVALAAHIGAAAITNHDTGESERLTIPPIDYDQRNTATMANFRDAILGIEACYLDPEDIYINTATSVMLTEQPHWRYE